VVAAIEDMKIRRSPQKVQDYDRDLRRIRELQQMRAEQDAKIKAKELREKKQAEILAQDINAKKKETTTTTKPKTASSTKKTIPSMNHFSTPSYR
jgi:septal ring factor EnvC (AmiA/AmiB activator)